MTWKEMLASKALSREFNIALNVTLGVLFGAMAIFTDHHWPAVIMAWSSGAQLGYATLWWIQPHISAKWRADQEREIAIMTAQVFHKVTREALDGQLLSRLVPDDTPPTHGRMN